MKSLCLPSLHFPPVWRQPVLPKLCVLVCVPLSVCVLELILHKQKSAPPPHLFVYTIDSIFGTCFASCFFCLPIFLFFPPLWRLLYNGSQKNFLILLFLNNNMHSILWLSHNLFRQIHVSRYSVPVLSQKGITSWKNKCIWFCQIAQSCRPWVAVVYLLPEVHAGVLRYTLAPSVAGQYYLTVVCVYMKYFQ